MALWEKKCAVCRAPEFDGEFFRLTLPRPIGKHHSILVCYDCDKKHSDEMLIELAKKGVKNVRTAC